MGSLQQISGSREERDRELNATFNSRYEILGELGRGAMGIVYKAHDRVIGRTVALKTIAVGHDAADHDEVIERLKREAKAAGSLDHPNIITIYDVGNDGDRVYLSMQFVEGVTLAELLAENKLPALPTRLSYADQICSAVAFAHERGVIHRDLKPSNLMITPQGQIKVLDFGIAKHGDTSMTQYGMVVGTPSYMAPEQATGKQVDHRSDVFALGAVFYELFTGKKAFTAESITAVLYEVVHEDPEPPASANPSLPAGVDAAIRRALAKNPQLRFQSCTEMRDALRKEAALFRSGAAAIAAKPPVDSGSHQNATSPRSRRAAQAAIAVCLLMAASVAVVWPQRTRMPRLMHLVGYLKQLGTNARTHLGGAAAPGPSASSQTAAAAPVPANTDAAPAGSATATPAPAPVTASPQATPIAGPQTPDSTSAPGQQAPAQSTAVADHGNDQHGMGSSSASAASLSASSNSPANAAGPAHTADPASAAAKDSQSEQAQPDAAGPGNDQPTDSQANVASTDSSTASKHSRNSHPAAGAPAAAPVVEGFTRKDIPDLLRKADAATGSGDYSSARYEYDIVLRLDRQNAKAREGLRRAREAAKEKL